MKPALTTLWPCDSGWPIQGHSVSQMHFVLVMAVSTTVKKMEDKATSERNLASAILMCSWWFKTRRFGLFELSCLLEEMIVRGST